MQRTRNTCQNTFQTKNNNMRNEDNINNNNFSNICSSIIYPEVDRENFNFINSYHETIKEEENNNI